MDRSSTQPDAPPVAGSRAGRRLLVGVVVTAHVVLVGYGASRTSPTIDEPAYLSAGVSHWKLGRFDLCQVSPPLVRLVAASVTLAADPQVDWSRYRVGPGIRSEHQVGRDFVLANGTRFYWMLTLARWACLPFSLLGAWVSYRWAYRLFDWYAGVTALTLWCFSPTILGHAQLMTPDVGVSALCLATCFSHWRWSQQLTWSGGVVTGLLLGLALLAKTNAVILIPALVVATILQASTAPRMRGWRTIAQPVASGLVALYVVNAGYGFENSFRSIRDYRLPGGTVQRMTQEWESSESPLLNIPLPLPASLVEGIDLQRRDFENEDGRRQTYFRGSWYASGWWWYYLYVFAVKVPVGTWVLMVLGGLVVMLQRSPRRVECVACLAVPGVALLALASSQTGFGGSIRYAMPALPFAFLLGSAALSRDACRWVRCLAAAALTAMMISSSAAAPHNLSYFNEIAGAADSGPWHVLGGNADVGQDTRELETWYRDHPQARPMYVDIYTADPLFTLGRDLAIEQPLAPGWYAISEFRRRQGDFRYNKLREANTVAKCGHSIRIFVIERPRIREPDVPASMID